MPELGAQAGVIITITSSFAPTLLQCMRTDTKRKQWVEVALLSRARVFTDEVEQPVASVRLRMMLRGHSPAWRSHRRPDAGPDLA
mgnify:CR=1 FL=1